MAGQLGKVIELGPHENMTPAETLATAARSSWSEVIVLGYLEGSNELTVMSSHMTRQEALWLIEHTKLLVMGRLD